MMKVLFDHQVFTMQQYGGISRYFANLNRSLNGRNGVQSEIGLLFTDNVYAKDQQQFGLLNGIVRDEPRRFKYNKWYGRHLIKKNDFDVFHPTYYHSYFLKPLKKPFVLTVHDMIHELYPQYFKEDAYKDYKSRVIEKADHIIAISACTKSDIQRFYNIPDSKITVVHHGYQMQQISDIPAPLKIAGQYLLFVGERRWYKNFEFFIRSVAGLIRENNLKVICAGGGAFRSDEIQLFNQLKLTGSISQLTATDAQLIQLYQRALAFVFPSLYEGFGLPILEAFHNNCPVILSNTSSFPEVGGDAVQYIDPVDGASVAAAVQYVMDNKTNRDELKLQGRERLKLFGFDKCVDGTLQVYRSLV